jgi:hypothetical protein
VIEKKIIYMKHLRKFNEEWIEDMFNDLERNRRTPEEIEDERTKRAEMRDKLDQENKEKTESDKNFQFRQAVRLASRNADPVAHQKMIDLLDEYGVDLIKDRRMMALKMAAEMGKEEVMDVLLNALEEAGEPNMDELKRNLEEYVRSGRG